MRNLREWNRRKSRAWGAVVLQGLIFVVCAGVMAEARPPRIERRVARAQAMLERESARTEGRTRASEQKAQPRRTAPANNVTPARPKSPALMPVPIEPRQEATGSRVDAATFETPVRPSPTPAAVTTAPATGPGEPAEDGTYSVLVRPEARVDARPAEPLRFPEVQSP